MAFRKFDYDSMPKLSEIESRVGSLATARKVRVAEIVEEGGKVTGVRPIQKRFGIKNERTGDIADFCSPIYSVLQHGSAVSMVIDSLKEKGIEARGFMKEWDNGVGLELFLDNVLLPVQGNEPVAASLRIPDGSEGIQLGMRFVNSYDKTSGFRGYGFGWRLACSNGMFLTHVLPEIRFSIRHTGQVVAKVGDKIHDAIRRLVLNRGALIAVVQEAQADVLHFATDREMVATLEAYVGSERRAENILNSRVGMRSELDITRWNLYNMLTDYATHSELSVSMYDRIQQGAERMLTQPVIVEAIPA